MGPADSRGIARVTRYSGSRHPQGRLRVRVTRYGGPFQGLPLASLERHRRSFYPGAASTAPVWAAPLSLAATRGITLVLFSCGYLDVSVPRVRLHPARGGYRPKPVGCPIRKPRDQRAFAPTPGLSRLVASFIASGSQGIHRPPSLASAAPSGAHVLSLSSFVIACPSCQ